MQAALWAAASPPVTSNKSLEHPEGSEEMPGELLQVVLKAIKEHEELQTAPNHLPIPPKSNAVPSKVGPGGREEAWRLARGCAFMVDGEDGKRGAGSGGLREDP